MVEVVFTEHPYLENWGVMPTLFGIPAYPLFMLSALVVGYLLFRREKRKAGVMDDEGVIIAAVAVIGGAIGAKLPMIIQALPEIIAAFPDITPLLSGRTITGGLLGGFIAVRLYKHYRGLKTSYGDLLVMPLTIGIIIGRIGCFFQGCCFGVETTLGCGVDFGDHILRHPTQLYEMGLLVILAGGMILFRKRNLPQGALFRFFLLGYLVIRFTLGFIRPEPRELLGLTLYQIIALGLMLIVGLQLFIILKKQVPHGPTKTR